MDQTLLATKTGEKFQPVRLHYQVIDPAGLARAMKKLRCLEYVVAQKRWVWLYDHEAKELPFEHSWAELYKKFGDHPVVIGSFFPRDKDHMVLDLRSCERALLAIPFFDEHLPRRLAKVTEAEIVNRLFAVAGNEKLTPESFFDRQDKTAAAKDPEALLNKIRDRAATVKDPLERLAILQQELASAAQAGLPEIERAPIHYYEDGLAVFTLTLRTRQMVAWEHFLGNTKYTLHDAIQACLR